MATQENSGRSSERAALSTEKPGHPSASSPGALLVERLTHEDIPAIAALYRRVFESFRPELPPELLKSFVPNPLEFTSWMENVTYFAARRDGKMIGAVGCEIADGSCRLVHLGVDPEHRRESVGTTLVNAAVAWARHNACNSVWIDVMARFNGAAALFKHLDFAECGVLHRHHVNEDVRFFEKLL